MVLETERLIMRRWEDGDADDLFKYASDPDVGPIAGWLAHQSIEESRDVIRNVLNGEEAYAVCMKEDGKAIGAIELKLNGHQEKCGFKYQWKSENVDVPLMHEKRTGYVSLMTKEDWLSGR